MIRIVLLGRTGNHLFQYALGRVLAERHGVPLVMDASWFNNAGWREVSCFLKLPLKGEVVRRCSPVARALRNWGGIHYWKLLRIPFLEENRSDQSFDARFLDAPSDCVLFGYFQTPRYFESMRDEYRTEINSLLKEAVSPGDDMVAKHRAPGSVAVHVRRGDYVGNAAFQVCGESYYRNCMDRMRGELPGCRFLIHSDDPGWCRATFRASDEEIVDSGVFAANPLHDLHLMSMARNHIIANSTYSWWAAWLGKKQGQIVLMPDRWYANESGIQAPIREKQPEGWTIVSTC